MPGSGKARCAAWWPMAKDYPYPPKMMLRPRAAHYCDLTEAGFEREVAAGRLPMPVMLDGKEHWNRARLDEALERLDGEEDFRKRSKLYASRAA